VTKIPVAEVEKIGKFELVDMNTIEFGYEKARFKFAGLLEKYFKQLKNKLTGNKVTYVHRNSGIPLIGNVAFGIVHRGSSIIEIKPVTSCNLDCVYCSISEGLSSLKNDFVVEEEYLVQELSSLLAGIDEKVEIHIGVQGEPFLYEDMELLIKDLQKMENVHTISIDTNGTLFNEERIDRLAACDKLQVNMSLDAIDPSLAKKIAGVKSYNVEHVKKMIEYASSRMKVIVAPVLTDDYNELEMEEIVKWIKTLKVQPILGIQNYLKYKTGRNAGKELSWDDFYKLLDKLERQYDIKLKLSKDDFGIKKVAELEKPFKVGDVVDAEIVCVDRFPNSVIAVAEGRNIFIPGVKFVEGKRIKVEIVRDKHNVFSGKVDFSK
tara:strand:+ start:6794 stop:7927 length:1134 start_codon:yes stop_codon:yes gene_type:complete